jgi:hypothetical protein
VLLLSGWLAAVVLANHRVNPLIHSSQLFAKGSGHEVVDRALQTKPGRILEYSTQLGAHLAAFGWPLLGGVQNSPNLALFRFLAPESPGLSEAIYNRYAHYHFELPPAQPRVVAGDDIRVAIHPCSPRLAALGVNHLLMGKGSKLEESCAREWDAQDAGDLRLWSRRSPVCAIGVATGMPQSAVEFDFSCGTEAHIHAGISAFSIEVPADPSRSWAVALNPAVVGDLECVGASGQFLDAHLVVRPHGEAKASCVAHYLDSLAALRRALKNGRQR